MRRGTLTFADRDTVAREQAHDRRRAATAPAPAATRCAPSSRSCCPAATSTTPARCTATA